MGSPCRKSINYHCKISHWLKAMTSWMVIDKNTQKGRNFHLSSVMLLNTFKVDNSWTEISLVQHLEKDVNWCHFFHNYNVMNLIQQFGFQTFKKFYRFYILIFSPFFRRKHSSNWNSFHSNGADCCLMKCIDYHWLAETLDNKIGNFLSWMNHGCSSEPWSWVVSNHSKVLSKLSWMISHVSVLMPWKSHDHG